MCVPELTRSTAILLLVVIGIIVYANCLPNELFWDDNDFILNNIYIHDWRWWPKFFTENVISGAHLVSNYWRPLLQTIFAVEWHLWADWAPGWHMTSIATHILAGTMLFNALDLLFKDRALTFLTALVFIIHPAQTESVVYPNSMGDALAAAFMFLGLWLYIRSRLKNNARLWWCSLAMFPLTLMSKETGILLVAFLALTEFFILTPDEQWLTRTLNALNRLWPFILVAIGYIGLRASVLNFSNSFNFYNKTNAFSSDILLRTTAFFSSLATYTGLLFIPHDLRVERMTAIQHTPPLPEILFGGMVFALLAFLALRCWNKKPIIAFGILWFFCAILPTSNLIVIINAVLYEHFLYTALIGIFLALFWTGLRWATTERRQRAFLTGTFILLIFFCGRSFWRTFDWRTAIDFYEKLAPTCPTSYRVLNNLGMEYANKKIWNKAELMYQKAIALDPMNAVAYHNLGNLTRDTGRKDLAIQCFEKAIALQKNFIFSYPSLIQLYTERGDTNNARRVLAQYLAVSGQPKPINTPHQ